MILSFSVPSMLPYISAGLWQRCGRDMGNERVKRQTIRRRGPRADAILGHAKDAGWTHPYDLHLWWKSRTPERRRLGLVEGGGYIYPITILHSTVQPPDSAPYPVVRIDGPRGWRDGDDVLFWSEGDTDGGFIAEAFADGFDSPQAFRDFFVPNVGDVFQGALFKW